MLSRGPRFVLALSTAVAALGGFLLGFDTAVIAGTTSSLSHVFALSPVLLGVTVSCALWGTVLGGSLAGAPAKRFGAREGLRGTAVLYLLSALGCASAHRWDAFLFFRLLTGVAIGGCSVFSPMYLSETAPPALRGRLVTCFQLSVVLGILLAYGSNAALSHLIQDAALWRWQLGIAALPAALFLVLLFTIPPSPEWLKRRGRLEEAHQVLRMFGTFEPVPAVHAEVLASADQCNPPSLFAPAVRKPLLLALALGAFNQLSGINAVLYYANDIFSSAGFGAISSGRQAIAIGVANLVFTLIGMLLIDSAGRKPLLLGGSAAMAFMLSGVAAVFLSGRFLGALLPLLIGFIAAFAVSQGAVVWVYLSEIFPAAVREQGQSLASSWLWLLAAIVSGLFPVIAAHSHGAPFLLFAAAMAVQGVVVLRFFPETKGRSLSEIEQVLHPAASAKEQQG